MNRAGTALVLLVALTTAACAGSSSPSSRTTPTGSPLPEGCPAVHGSGFAAIDYVDFIQAFGRQYVAGVVSRPSTVKESDLGRVVLRSRCSFGKLNDRTHKDPGKARDGDTAFLAAGTPIYAIDGWSPQCRLAARSGASGQLVAYLALETNAKHATARACALHH